MTTNFYAPPSAFRKNRVVLPEREARHARKVLRVEQGDTIPVVDGQGGWYQVRVDHLAPQQVVGTIVDRQKNVGEPEIEITVALAVLTKRQRFETFVEKAVELGVSEIVPLRTRRTEAENVREERLRKISVAALKQCRRSRLPTLHAPRELDPLLQEKKAEKILLCHSDDQARPLLQVVDDPPSASSLLILVGPEGGFAASEVEAIREAGGIAVSLGDRRLRAETAALAALTAVSLVHEECREEA